MKITRDIVIADLESRYKKIVEEKNNGRLFLKIADYGKYLVEINDYLDEINLSLIEDSKSDRKRFDDSFDNFINIWKPLAKDLLSLATDNNIVDDINNPFSNGIRQVTEELKNPTSPELLFGDVESFYSPYVEIIEKFKEKGIEKKLLNKHINKNNEFILYESYKVTKDEWEKFKNRRELMVWWAHYNILRMAFGVYQMDGVENFFKQNRIIDSIYQWEFDQISQGYTQNLIILKENKFRDWLDILHNYLIPRLESIPENKFGLSNKTEDQTIQPIPNGWSLEEQGNKLILKKNKADFFVFPKSDSNKCKYFKKIWEKNGKKVGFKELYNSTGLIYPDKKGENNKVNKLIRDTLRKLNKEFENKNIPIKLIEEKGYRINFN